MSIRRLVEQARGLAEGQRYDDALYIWRDVCALGPVRAEFRVEMAACLVALGAEDEAVFELQTALAIEPGVMSRLESDERFTAIVHQL